jgi:hypothetical protein
LFFGYAVLQVSLEGIKADYRRECQIGDIVAARHNSSLDGIRQHHASMISAIEQILDIPGASPNPSTLNAAVSEYQQDS